MAYITEMYFLIVLKATSPRSSCQQVWLLLSLASRWPVLCVSPWGLVVFVISFFKIKKKTLFILEREEGREKERQRNINVCCPLHGSFWGPDPQPRHVPCLGIEPATLGFTGWHSVHWATPARASHFFLFAEFYKLSFPPNFHIIY